MSFMKHYGPKFEMFKQILQKDNPIIVEIGAHYGEDTMRFLETFKNAEIYCFEPDPRNIMIFKKHVDNKKIRLFEYALSDKESIMDFHLSHDNKIDSVPEKYDWISIEDYSKKRLSNSGASSLKKGYSKNFHKISVRTRRFDNWVIENYNDTIDLVWMDVQGAEKEVLNGMGLAVKNIKFIWMEYGEKSYEGAMDRIETITFMNLLGFNEVPEHSDTTLQGDLLFRNKN
jgi:FkbM family methyltransferase